MPLPKTFLITLPIPFEHYSHSERSEESPPFTEFTLSEEPRSFTEPALSEQLRCFASLSMTSEGFRMTSEGFRVTPTLAESPARRARCHPGSRLRSTAARRSFRSPLEQPGRRPPRYPHTPCPARPFAQRAPSPPAWLGNPPASPSESPPPRRSGPVARSAPSSSAPPPGRSG